jgi:tRNA modification GTPase
VVDASQPLENMKKIASQIEPRLVDQKCVIVFNKMDLIDEEKRKELSAYAKEFTDNQIFISAKKELNTEKLEELLVEASQVPEVGENDVMVTNLRHYEALKNARFAIERVEEGMEMQISGDFLSQDIRECLHYLGEITGEITTDEVLGNIFMKFCIGK